MADRLRRRASTEDGFGLVEIMIAMIIFGIVAAATAPLLIGGLKAGRMAQLNLQGKALGQERLERMRNMPYHVAMQNGLYLDVLDIYFRDLVAVGSLAAGDTCSARAYNSATSTYSCTVTNFGAGYPGFSQVVSTQFLRFDRSVVVPSATYSSQVAGADPPVANLLGVTVKTSWTQAGKAQSFTVRSNIANAQADPDLLTASLDATAVDITSNLASGDILQFQGGLISGQGALTTGSTAGLSAVSARAGLASGTSTAGAAVSLSAPPTAAGTSPSDSSGHFVDGSTCTFACFGSTAVSGDQNLSVLSGMPKVSLSTDPVTALLRRTGSSAYRGFTYNNATPAATNPSLGITGAMVSGGGGGGADVLSGAGYLDGTGTGASSVRSSGTVRFTELQLFPTSFAPNGVVRVTLSAASLTCQSGIGSASVTSSWSGVVSYWSQASGGYVDLTLAPGMAALPNPSSLLVQPGRPLSTWIQAWTALTSPSLVNQTSGRQAKGTVSAVLSILTAQTRTGDVTSPINLALGSLVCVAEDNR